MAVSAERLVQERIGAALPEGARCYPNVRFVAKTRERGPGHDGEADLVVVDPVNGLLVIEVKSGVPRRERNGDWFIGGHPLKRSPFAQAEAAKHDLRRAIEALPDWPANHELRAGHAVAFPDVDLASLPNGHSLLGSDAKTDLVLDADAFEAPEATRQALERAWAWWVGDGARGDPLSSADMARIDEFLAPTVELRRLIRHDVEEGTERLIRISNAQTLVLNVAKNQRRVEVIGPAGSGKSLVAVEKARRLAKEGWQTLFVCFNQALATAVLREFDDEGEAPDRRPTVSTFHRLAETLATRAGLLETKPPNPDRTGSMASPPTSSRRSRPCQTSGTTRLSSTRARTSTPTGWSGSSSCSGTPTMGSCGSSTIRGRRCSATTWSRTWGSRGLTCSRTTGRPRRWPSWPPASTAGRASRSR